MKYKFNEYLYRDIWINRCNDNYISNSYTDNIHLKSIPDEINVEGAAALCSPPKQSASNKWKKTDVI